MLIPVQKHQPKNPKVPNNLGLLTKKKHKDKVRWVAAEEAAIIMTLLTQKVASNVSESSFKPMVWSLVVQAVAGATTDGFKQDTLQCKMCYQWVSFVFSSHSFIWV